MQNIPEIHSTPLKLESGANPGRASNKNYVNIKSGKYSRRFNHIRTLTTTSPFGNFQIPNWSCRLCGRGLKNNLQNDTSFILKIFGNDSRRTRMDPKMVPKSVKHPRSFLSGTSQLRPLVPRTPGEGYRTQMDSKRNLTVAAPPKWRALLIHIAVPKFLQEFLAEFCSSLDSCEKTLYNVLQCWLPEARWRFWVARALDIRIGCGHREYQVEHKVKNTSIYIHTHNHKYVCI